MYSIKSSKHLNYNVEAFLVFVQYILYFIHLFTGERILNFVILAVGLFNIIFSLLMRKTINIKVMVLLLFISIVIIICSIISPQYDEIYDIYTFLFGVVCIFNAYFIMKIRDISNYLFVFFWFMTFVIFSTFIKHGISDPNIYNLIFASSSRNYVSMIYLFILIMLHLEYFKNNKFLPVRYSLIAFMGSVILFGRSGIIVSSLILIFSLLKSRHSLLLKFSILFMCIIAIFINYNIIVTFLDESTSFRQGMDSPRSFMMEEYFIALKSSLYNILFGINLEICCSTIAEHDFNTHNSFLSGHVRFGIVHTILSMGIFMYIISKKDMMLSFFVCVIFMRYWLDQVGLFSLVDIVLFYLLLLAYYSKK